MTEPVDQDELQLKDEYENPKWKKAWLEAVKESETRK